MVGYLGLDDIFLYGGSSEMPGRTWVFDVDPEQLKLLWKARIAAPDRDQNKGYC